MRKSTHTWKSFINATKYAWEGLVHAWKYEASFQEELIIYIPLALFSPLIGKGICQILLLIFSLVFVLVVEVLNTGIERTVDLISDQKHPLAKQAKDLGAGAVLLTNIFALVVWISIIITRLI